MTRAARGGSRVARVSSFAPVIGADCRVLVLGSMPGVRSLAAGQYYAHPHNLFWPFMRELCGAGPELPYADRLARLAEAGIGLWDVLGHCTREGSLDSSIDPASEVANPIDALLVEQASIRAVAFNGAKAHAAFRRHVAPRIPVSRHTRLDWRVMPSTSPANASLRREAKLERWLALGTYLRSSGPTATSHPR